VWVVQRQHLWCLACSCDVHLEPLNGLQQQVPNKKMRWHCSAMANSAASATANSSAYQQQLR
jgi:hypothetical protein